MLEKTKKDELRNLYEEQIRLEYSVIKSSRIATKHMKNIILSELTIGIALNSVKHANLYRGLSEILDFKELILSEADKEKIIFHLNKILDAEEKILEQYNLFADLVTDSNEKKIIERIFAEEKEYCTLLRKAIRLVKEKEKITKNDLWGLCCF